MGVHSGKFGVVDGVDTVRNWTIAQTSSLVRFAASNTAGGAGRRRGVNAWTGGYARYGAQPLHYPGEFFTFTGYAAPDDDTLGGDGTIYTGQAIVDSVAITWDWTTAAILAQTVGFSGHLVLETNTGTHEDTGDVVAPEIHGTNIRHAADLAGLATPTVLNNITTCTLTLTAANQGYVNSSTYDSTTQKIWTGRRAGQFDWTMSITVQDTDAAVLPAIESQKAWRLYTSATEYWQLIYGRVRDWTGITVDVETGAIVTATINVDMDGVKTGVGLGSVIAPNADQLWPLVVAP